MMQSGSWLAVGVATGVAAGSVIGLTADNIGVLVSAALQRLCLSQQRKGE